MKETQTLGDNDQEKYPVNNKHSTNVLYTLHH